MSGFGRPASALFRPRRRPWPIRIPLRIALSATILAAVGTTGSALHGQTDPPYVPTPEPILQAMLELAEVAVGDRVVDLGSGDGRLVLAAAERGATALGIELREDLVGLSRNEAHRRGLSDRATFFAGDILDADWGDPTVVLAYLSPELMQALEPRLRDTLAPGTRVVSHAFPIPGWEPKREVTLERWGGRITRLFLWEVDGGGGDGGRIPH